MAVAAPPQHALAPELDELADWLVQLANQQYESPEYRKHFAVPMSTERARFLTVQNTLFTVNRRDCWPFVMGKAPLDVKRLVWEHEEDELIGTRDSGKIDHFTLAIQEGAVFGLTPKDFEVEPVDSLKTCFWAWRHLAESRPWLEALACSSVLEVTNNDALIKGGAMSRRRGVIFQEQLGIPMKKLVSVSEHIEADVTHALMLMKVARQHVQSTHDIQAIKRAAQDSLTIFRVYFAAVAAGMLALPGPKS